MATNLHPAWQDFRARRRLCWAAWLSTPPALWIFSRIAESFSGSDVPVLFAVPWMLALGICIVRYGSFRCPRCGERFFTEKNFPWVTRMWTGRCMNCGLNRWAIPERDRTAP
jgi:hypothetical protein